MKKKPSKLLASITAAAMAVMCAVVAVPEVEVSAAAPLHTIEWKWEGGNELLEGIEDASAVKKAVVNVVYDAKTSEYSNGQVTSNSNGTIGSDGWKQTPFGVDDSHGQQLTAGTAADIEIEVVGVTDWITVGVVEYGGGTITVNSVKLLDKDDTVLSTATVGKTLGKGYAGDNSNITGFDATKAGTITKAVANLQYSADAGKDSNGQFYVNGNDGWKGIPFGIKSGVTVSVAAGTATDVELEVSGITDWLQFGVTEYGGGTLTVNSIKFLDAKGEIVYELPAAAAPNPPDVPDEPDKPDQPSGDAIWSGSKDIATWSDNLVIDAAKFSAVKGGDKISITYEELDSDAQLKVVANFGDWDGLASTKPNEWGCAPISGSPYTFTLSDDDAALLKEHGMAFLGEHIKLTKVELAAKSGSTPGGDDKPTKDPEVKDPENKTDVAVEADKDAIKGAVKLTDEEKTKEVTVQLKVETATLDDTAKTKVNEAAASKGLTVSDTALDITLIKTVDSVSSEAELTKAISVTVAVPAALIDSTKTREYFVIHYHDGKADILTGVLTDGKFTFDVSGFSAFVLAYKDKATEPSGDAAWEGNHDIGSWDNALTIGSERFSAVKGGDSIKITYTEPGGEAQLQINDSTWTFLASSNPNEWGCAPISGSPYTFTLSESDAALVKAGGIILNGQNIVITKVEIVSGGTTPVDPVDPTPKPVAKPVYSVTVNSGYAAVTGDRTEGSEMTVSVATGFAARVYNGNTLIATIYSEGKFTMPAANVVIIVTDESGAGMMAYTAPNSYIFTYDSQMKLIKTTRSKKGISGTGEMTVKLGAEYAGKTVTLYSGKNSTTNKITEAELDSKGCATFTVEGAKNYTLVVED